MQAKYKIPFTSEEFDLVKYSFKRVGEKHGCSGSMISKVARGLRNPETELGKAVVKTLKEILRTLQS